MAVGEAGWRGCGRRGGAGLVSVNRCGPGRSGMGSVCVWRRSVSSNRETGASGRGNDGRREVKNGSESEAGSASSNDRLKSCIGSLFRGERFFQGSAESKSDMVKEVVWWWRSVAWRAGIRAAEGRSGRAVQVFINRDSAIFRKGWQARRGRVWRDFHFSFFLSVGGATRRGENRGVGKKCLFRRRF